MCRVVWPACSLAAASLAARRSLQRSCLLGLVSLSYLSLSFHLAAVLCTEFGNLPCLPSALPSPALQEAELVPRMLQFRRDMQSVLHNSFAGHTDFAQALKEGEAPPGGGRLGARLSATERVALPPAASAACAATGTQSRRGTPPCLLRLASLQGLSESCMHRHARRLHCAHSCAASCVAPFPPPPAQALRPA